MPKEREMPVEEKVYHMIMSQSFEDWHRKDFDDHLMNEKGCKSKKQILEDIKRLLGR